MMMYGAVLYATVPAVLWQALLAVYHHTGGEGRVCSTNSGMDFPWTTDAPRHDSSLQEPLHGYSALLAASGQPGAE